MSRNTFMWIVHVQACNVQEIFIVCQTSVQAYSQGRNLTGALDQIQKYPFSRQIFSLFTKNTINFKQGSHHPDIFLEKEQKLSTNGIHS